LDSRFNAERYARVVSACALDTDPCTDLDMLEVSNATLIGERGINLCLAGRKGKLTEGTRRAGTRLLLARGRVPAGDVPGTG
jgi:hypothetical protein